MDRPLWMIAKDIRQDWQSISAEAKRCVRAMHGISAMSDDCGYGYEIVSYFLSLASSWRGDVAKQIKSELRNMLKH